MRIGGARARGAILIAQEDSAHTSFEDAVTALTADQALILALDGITDPHNLGAVLRSADQFRVDLVVLPERRSASVNDTVSRTSAGADRWVRYSVVPNLVRALTFLQERGFWIYGADASGAPAHTVTLTGRTVLVLGREGEGLHRLVRDTCDGLVAIPTGGRIDSLNVSVSAGVLLYEVRRQADFAALKDRWSHESS
jgi:23S rRNA (guanosine2251-2'-O)-methyltransferase